MRYAALIAAVLLLAAAPAAEAGKRRVPRGFYGAVWDHYLLRPEPDVEVRHLAAMARNGVESVRTVFSWARIQPTPDGAPDWSETDLLVAQAARRRIRLLPVVMYAPRWARRYPDRGASPPASVYDYTTFLGQLVERYGPDGTFWFDHPELRRVPLRSWQIWNEPHLQYQWDVREGDGEDWPSGYADLVRAADGALDFYDPGARVVLAGLSNFAWRELATLYRQGLRPYFDVVALQVYTGKPENVIRAVRFMRGTMRRRGDRRKPLWITEAGWPAARGRTNVPRYHRSIVTSDRGMALRLARLYTLAVRNRRRYRIGRVYWYTWASPYSGDSIFGYAGLLRFNPSRSPARPALFAYRRLARRHEGCAKTSFGACRRRR